MKPQKPATPQLSGPQRAALFALDDVWSSAYDLQLSMQTLDALVKRGLAERRNEAALGAMFSPRTVIQYRRRAS